MMDKHQYNMIKIVRSALTMDRFVIPDDFDFEKAIKEANIHQITGMLYYGALNSGVSPETEEMQKLFSNVCMHIMILHRQKYQIDKMTEAFDKNNIDYMLLKGCNLRYMYPKPEMRIMGDADILIKTDQYEKIRIIMQDLGFEECSESDHEYVWKNSSILVELHKRMIPSYNKDYYDYYGDGWKLALRSNDNENKYILSPEDEMIYVFTHFAKHYRDAGVGIRHIIDVWVFRNSHPDLNEEYILTELKKLKLDEFYKNILDTFKVWFEDDEPNPKTEMITNIIFKSGAYGTKKAHLLSDAVKRSKSGTIKTARIQKIMTLIFTPYKPLSDLYPILKKVPVLLPFAWVYHWFDVLINRRTNITKRNNDRKIITEDNITSYQDSLKFVGLDFNFKS